MNTKSLSAIITDSQTLAHGKIPEEYIRIEKLRRSKEVRLGKHLIELGMGRKIEVGSRDMDFFNLAKKLYLCLDNKTQLILNRSYETGKGSNDSCLDSAKTTTCLCIEFYDSRIPIEFLFSVLTQLNNRKLPLEDLLFVLNHPDPKGCPAKTFAMVIDTAPSTVKRYLKMGIIEADKFIRPQSHIMGHAWRIRQNEQIRIIDLCRNWVPCYLVANTNQISRQVFRQFVLRGHFGIYSYSLSGYLIILREEVKKADIRKRFFDLQAQKKKIRCEKPRFKYSFLCKSEQTLAWVAKQCGVCKITGYDWKERGLIKCFRRGFHWIVKIEDYHDFIERVSHGRIEGISSKVVKRCKELNQNIDQN